MAGRGFSLLLLAVALTINCNCSALSRQKLTEMGETFKKEISIKYKGYQERMELVFVLDQSGSIGYENFLTTILFMRNTLSELSVNRYHTRVSIIRFGTDVKVDVRLDEELDKCALFRKIAAKTDKYEGGMTNTNGGLKEAMHQLTYRRKGAIRLVITVTDGKFNKGEDPKDTATKMKNDDIIMIAFGIGKIDSQKLRDIATTGLDHKVEEFTEFKMFGEIIYRSKCFSVSLFSFLLIFILSCL